MTMALARCAVLSLSLSLADAVRLGDEKPADLGDETAEDSLLAKRRVFPPSEGYKMHREKTLLVNGSGYCNKCVLDKKKLGQCTWDTKKGTCQGKDNQCYYPAGDDAKDNYGARGYGYEFNKEKRGFGVDAMGCLNQATARSRFDGQPLSLEEDFDQACIKAFYGPSIQNQWGDGIMTNVRATDWQLKEMRESCLKIGEKFSYGKKDIVLIVANTPRKAELAEFLDSIEDMGKVLDPYYLSGTATTLGKLNASYPELEKNFVPEVYGLHTESGPKGGDIQGGALMATGRVAALIFFQSYQTECHKCDIQSMVQTCLGLEKKGELMCAFDKDKGKEVMQQLKKDCPKVYKDGKYTCRSISKEKRLWGVASPEKELDDRHDDDDGKTPLATDGKTVKVLKDRAGRSFKPGEVMNMPKGSAPK